MLVQTMEYSPNGQYIPTVPQIAFDGDRIVICLEFARHVRRARIIHFGKRVATIGRGMSKTRLRSRLLTPRTALPQEGLWSG